MKKSLLWVIAIGISALTWAGTPTNQDLAGYYQQGQVCLCIHFTQPTCNTIVWCGTYNGWNTDVNNLLTFQEMEGFDGWYVAAFYDNSNPINGKPVQLKPDGSFDWKYQTGNVDTWQVHSGTVSIVNNNPNEAELRNISTSSPLILTSTEWKNEVSCVPPAKPEPSGTLPVLYINTENKTPITSKEDYVTATYYLDNLNLPDYTSIASKELPDTMQIKGRGNYTWSGFDKKPYRLKLNNKQALLGLEKNKHWTLLAHADDQFGWLKNTVGFLLSEQLGMRWTPKQKPVEVVLNGDYIGLYMLTEQIRVDKKRVNIVEQEDGCTHNDSITGGWLVEIDNYAEPYHVEVTEPANQWHNTQTIMITPRTPEILSTAQQDYLRTQMENINYALYDNDEEDLVQLLDMDEAAKFYLVQELMSDCESYHGSCYLYKEIGNNEKWYFGPVWDFGNSFRDQDKFIYDHPTWSQNWIGQLAGKQAFQNNLTPIWQHWRSNNYSQITNAVDSFTTLIQYAAASDAARWPQYNHADVITGKNNFMSMFNRHVNFLTQEWGIETCLEQERLNNWNEERGACRGQKYLINGHLYILYKKQIYPL